MNQKQKYPPGPRGLPFVGVLPKMWQDPLNYLRAVAAKYGDVATVDFGSRKALLLSRPEDIRYVLRDNYRNYEKSSTVSITKRVLGRGLATNSGEFWHHQRRLMQPAFHRQVVAGLAEQVTAVSSTALNEWPTGKMDVHAALMNLALRVIFQTMFSSQVADVDALAQAWTAVLKQFNAQSWALLRIPDSWPTPANRRFDAAMSLLDETVAEMIAARRIGPPQHDLLQLLLDAQDEETGAGMDDRQVRDEIMTIFLAGHETSAIGMSWAMYLLAENPDKLAILRDQVDGVCNGRTPTYSDLQNLPYARMVIDEALRLYPPFWLIYRAPVGPDKIAGYAVGERDMVFICPSIVHRNPEFWQQPDLFLPERFGANEKRPSPFIYFPFGAGPRMCIGNEFALIEMQLVLAGIVQKFDFQLLPDYPVTPEATVTLRPRGGLWMQLSLR